MNRWISLAAGFAVAAGILLVPTGLPAPAVVTAAVAGLMVVWWITEAVPLEVTALVPLVAFPLAGVLTPREAAAPYADPVIFLFLGGFIIAAAMQRWGLHRRIALALVMRTGSRPRGIVLGFMAATAFLSLWISNSATAMMMVPIALAVAGTAAAGGDPAGEPSPAASASFTTCLVLSVAYAASIGGMGTLIGSPPNGILASQMGELFPAAPQVGFFDWLLIGLPFVVIFLPLAWAWLTFGVFRDMPRELPLARDHLRQEREAMGPMGAGERWTLVVICLVALAWIFAETKQIGGITVPGLDVIIPGITDASIAIAGAILLFLLPADREKGIAVMDWDTAAKIPWGILLLFGGGLCLSAAFLVSGLAREMAGLFSGLAGVNPVLVIFLFGLFVVLATEITSNTAIASVMMPVTAVTAVAIGMNPLYLMLTAAICASMGFMLPVATPPNAIVFSTGRVPQRDMIRAGAGLNLIGLVLWTIFAVTVLPALTGTTMALPAWAGSP